MLSENKEILFFFFDKYNLPSSLKGDTQTRSKKAWIRSMIESLLQCTSQRFQWRSFFTHHNKDGAGRLSSIEDCQVWLPKWWISSIVLVGGQNTIGNKRRFSCLQSNQKGVDMKIIYMTLILQPEVQHSLDTEVFVLALRNYSTFCKKPLLSLVQAGIIEKLFFGQVLKWQPLSQL